MEGKNTFDRWETFCDIYNKGVELCVPLHRPRSNNQTHPKWMNRQVRSKIEKKKEAWQSYRERKTPLRRRLYTVARNDATSSVRKAKYEHEKRVAKDVLDNSKHFWRYTRNKTRVNEVVTKVRNNEGVLTKNDTETAEVMNEAFNSVYVREDQSNVLPALQNNYQGNTL